MLLIPAGVILGAGLLTLSAISSHLFLMQLAFAGAGLLLILLFRYVDLSGILRARWFAWGFYLATVGLLALTYLTAPVIRNTRSWLVLGPFQFQPVELAKVALIIILAGYFSRRHMAIGRAKHVLASTAIFALPAGLTLLQPDLGSASILFGIWFGFLLVSGLPRRWIIISAVVLAIGAVVGWRYFLEDYQKARLSAVFYPERNALGINYSTIQSKIAIGSSGFWGKGYDQGSQTQLGFLTEPGTDFIFAALVEEWGAFGGLLVLFAFLLLIFFLLRRGNDADNNFEHLVALGIAIAFGLQFLVNAGSATGIFPVVGVTFPFLSYGGSSLLINSLLLGIVYGIRPRTT